MAKVTMLPVRFREKLFPRQEQFSVYRCLPISRATCTARFSEERDADKHTREISRETGAFLLDEETGIVYHYHKAETDK